MKYTKRIVYDSMVFAYLRMSRTSKCVDTVTVIYATNTGYTCMSILIVAMLPDIMGNGLRLEGWRVIPEWVYCCLINVQAVSLVANKEC